MAESTRSPPTTSPGSCRRLWGACWYRSGPSRFWRCWPRCGRPRSPRPNWLPRQRSPCASLPTLMNALLESLAAAKVYDLAQPYFVGMPHHPAHPPFLYSLVKQHGEYVGLGGNSSASDAIALGSHVGTHIDALCHFSCGGKLYGGEPVAGNQSYAAGLTRYSIDTIPPIYRRGVLLDLAPGSPLPA